MKKYLLLRDNHQSGPWTLEELVAKDIVATDLVWIEHTSTAWAFPSEIDELKEHITEKKIPVRHIYVERPVVETTVSLHDHEEISLQTNIIQPVEELKERLEDFRHKGPVWNKNGSSFSEIMQVAAVFMGLVIGAFVIKKAVDGFGSPSLAESNVLPANIIAEEIAPNPGYATALLTEVIPARDTVARVIKKVKPRDIKKQLSIKGSEYKVGLLGGINGLQLKVFNASPHAVDQVTVAVQYMKRNGDVVHTDQYEMSSIKPYGVRSLQVPDSKRGVKVKYKIVEVKSKDYSKALKQV